MPVSVAESEENSVVANMNYASHHSNKDRRDLMMLTDLGGQPSLKSMANRPSRLTVSKALVRSTKRMYRF